MLYLMLTIASIAFILLYAHLSKGVVSKGDAEFARACNDARVTWIIQAYARGVHA